MSTRNVIDFAAARRRIDATAIQHNATAVELEFVPKPPTLLERMRHTLTDAQLAELVRVALEESK